MIRRTMQWARLPRHAAAAIVLISIGIAVAACDFDVVNPGPLRDSALDDPGAHTALVNGAERALADGLDIFAISGAAPAREVQASGSTGFAGTTIYEELGQLLPDEQDGPFTNSHQSRWVAEEGIRRVGLTMSADQQASYAPLSFMYLWAGYANKILGEHMCTAVFNGGKAEPYKNHLERAITHFTKAAEIAKKASNASTERAALAGRAAVNLYLGKFAEAEADAGLVPANFVHVMPYYLDKSPDYDLIKALSDHAVRGITTWNTVYEKYYLETGDPRAAWGFDKAKPIGENKRTTYGDVPFYYPLKYFRPRTSAVYRSLTTKDATAMRNLPVKLASGLEMQLIIAERRLQQGNWQAAMQIINGRRAGLTSEATTVHADKGGKHTGGTPLVAWQATNVTEAWTALKRERGIELWQEGRRLGDLRRWRESNAPGTLHPLEYIPDALVTRFGVKREPDVCFPIPRSEQETNPNIGLGFKG